MSRRCWTCNTEHDLDAACPASRTVRSMKAAGAPGNTLADHTSPDLFDDADDQPDNLGPVFMASYDSECDACDGAIWEGDRIRAWTGYGYIHARRECEDIARD